MAASSSSMEQRIRFHEMIQRGVSPEDILQMRLEQNRWLVDSKIAQIRQALLGRQREAASIIEGLIRELEAIDPLEAAKEQNEFLKITVEKMEEVQKDLLEKLEPVEKEGKEQKEAKAELQATLRMLQRQAQELGQSQNHQVENFLYSAGTRVNQYISSHTGAS